MNDVEQLYEKICHNIVYESSTIPEVPSIMQYRNPKRRNGTLLHVAAETNNATFLKRVLDKTDGKVTQIRFINCSITFV